MGISLIGEKRVFNLHPCQNTETNTYYMEENICMFMVVVKLLAIFVKRLHF